MKIGNTGKNITLVTEKLREIQMYGKKKMKVTDFSSFSVLFQL